MKYILKPFDLEKAKAGHAVCTKEGRTVRILCYDRKTFSGLSMVALITDNKGNENLNVFLPIGDTSKYFKKCSLFMFHREKKKKVKKEGWINIYKGDPNTPHSHIIYSTKELAVGGCRIGNQAISYIATVKVKWKEELKE